MIRWWANWELAGELDGQEVRARLTAARLAGKLVGEPSALLILTQKDGKWVAGAVHLDYILRGQLCALYCMDKPDELVGDLYPDKQVAGALAIVLVVAATGEYLPMPDDLRRELFVIGLGSGLTLEFLCQD